MACSRGAKSVKVERKSNIEEAGLTFAYVLNSMICPKTARKEFEGKVRVSETRARRQ